MSEAKVVCGKCKDAPSMLCVFTIPDSCPFAAILRALPQATPEALVVVEAVLEGRYHVGEPADLMAIASSPYHPEKKITVLIPAVQDTPDTESSTPPDKCGESGICPTCGGSGYTDDMIPPSRVIEYVKCPTCNGTGRLR